MTKKEIIKKILRCYLITRIFLIFLMILDNFLLKTKYPDIPSIFYLYDGEHYLNIAKNGYTIYYLYAFFPGVPLLIRYLGKIGFLLINQICVALTSYLLYIIGDKYLKLKKPLTPVVFWLISPIALMTMLFYTESIFVFLTVLVYYLYKEQNYYLILGIILGLCSTVRSTGSILFFTLFILMIIDLFKKKIKIKNIIITYIPATIISCLYPAYLYFKTGNSLKFVEVQSYWLKEKTNIFRILYDVVIKTIQDPQMIFIINSILTIVIVTFFIKYIVNHHKEKNYYDIYLYFIMTLIIICTSIKGNGDPLTSYYRYIFACFPVYYMIKDKFINYALLAVFSINVCSFFLFNTYFF